MNVENNKDNCIRVNECAKNVLHENGLSFSDGKVDNFNKIFCMEKIGLKTPNRVYNVLEDQDSPSQIGMEYDTGEEGRSCSVSDLFSVELIRNSKGFPLSVVLTLKDNVHPGLGYPDKTKSSGSEVLSLKLLALLKLKDCANPELDFLKTSPSSKSEVLSLQLMALLKLKDLDRFVEKQREGFQKSCRFAELGNGSFLVGSNRCKNTYVHDALEGSSTCNNIILDSSKDGESFEYVGDKENHLKVNKENDRVNSERDLFLPEYNNKKSNLVADDVKFNVPSVPEKETQYFEHKNEKYIVICNGHQDSLEANIEISSEHDIESTQTSAICTSCCANLVFTNSDEVASTSDITEGCQFYAKDKAGTNSTMSPFVLKMSPRARHKLKEIRDYFCKPDPLDKDCDNWRQIKKPLSRSILEISDIPGKVKVSESHSEDNETPETKLVFESIAVRNNFKKENKICKDINNFFQSFDIFTSTDETINQSKAKIVKERPRSLDYLNSFPPAGRLTTSKGILRKHDQYHAFESEWVMSDSDELDDTLGSAKQPSWYDSDVGDSTDEFFSEVSYSPLGEPDISLLSVADTSPLSSEFVTVWNHVISERVSNDSVNVSQSLSFCGGNGTTYSSTPSSTKRSKDESNIDVSFQPPGGVGVFDNYESITSTFDSSLTLNSVSKQAESCSPLHNSKTKPSENLNPFEKDAIEPSIPQTPSNSPKNIVEIGREKSENCNKRELKPVRAAPILPESTRQHQIQVLNSRTK